MPRRRRRIMGIPVGKAKKSFPLGRAAQLGVVGATAAVAAPKVVGRVRQATSGVQDAKEGLEDIKDSVSSHSSTVGKAAGLVGAVSRMGKGGDDKPKLAHLIEEHTDVSVPRSVAYNQWTQMEMLPRIVKGIDSVEQLSDERTQWRSKIGPVKRTWRAKIVEQVPDERIHWKSENGPQHEGVVTFHSLDDELTRVLVQMHYKPSGPLEVVANKLRIQRRRVRRDLRLFKHFVDMRGEETGEWRGQIGEDPNERAGSSPSGRRPARRNAGSRRPESGSSANGSSSTRRGSSSRPAASSRRASSDNRSRNGSGNGASGAERTAKTQTAKRGEGAK